MLLSLRDFCTYKVSFQFVTSLVLHHVDKTLGSEGFKLCQKKKKRGEVMCQIPPFPPLYQIRHVNNNHNILSLSSFSLAASLVQWKNSLLFSDFASFVDLFRSTPK